jgi:transcriptional regulator with XRE-family HTH domain
MTEANLTPERIPEWTLGDRLRKARLYANVSTEEMAEDIGRTIHTISNYERDFTKAPLLVIRQYALRTGVPFEWLLTGVVTIGYPRLLELVAA